jgi:thiamine biosynthesis lipoprotein
MLMNLMLMNLMHMNTTIQDQTGYTTRQNEDSYTSSQNKASHITRYKFFGGKGLQKFLIFSLLSALLLTSCSLPGGGSTGGTGSAFSRTGNYFDTVITVTVYKKSQEKYLDGCMDLAKKYENLFSTTVADSDISKINAAKGQPVEVDPETASLIETGLSYSRLSNGAFDITVGRLSALWQDAIKNKEVPSEDAVNEARASIGYQAVSVENNTVTVSNPEAEIDLGGIAKGYIADRMKDYLKKNGVKSGIINLGGNVLTLGAKADGSSYNIGIQKPFSTTGEVAAKVSVKNLSVVTSGTYERYFKKDGKIYHHILNLSTGYPEENDVDSATIFSKKSVDGDALSTIAFLLGPDKGIPLIESLGFECAYIMKDGSVKTSTNLDKKTGFTVLNK